jgi:hypothetical protein
MFYPSIQRDERLIKHTDTYQGSSASRNRTAPPFFMDNTN